MTIYPFLLAASILLLLIAGGIYTGRRLIDRANRQFEREIAARTARLKELAEQRRENAETLARRAASSDRAEQGLVDYARQQFRQDIAERRAAEELKAECAAVATVGARHPAIRRPLAAPARTARTTSMPSAMAAPYGATPSMGYDDSRWPTPLPASVHDYSPSPSVTGGGGTFDGAGASGDWGSSSSSSDSGSSSSSSGSCGGSD